MVHSNHVRSCRTPLHCKLETFLSLELRASVREYLGCDGCIDGKSGKMITILYILSFKVACIVQLRQKIILLF